MRKLLLVLFMIGCSSYKGPYKKCLSSHVESSTILQYNIVLKMILPTKINKEICDKHDEFLYIKKDNIEYKVIEEIKE